ncbi:MAG: hypothetical protein IPL47_12780 [Phyllobacteriaceae bacterium]|nr:hypothetical protein [Phyllobacteriaceae bacterium]
MMKKLFSLAVALALTPSLSIAQTDCGLCAKTIVINSALAGCFLKRFPEWQSKSTSAIVVDLAGCEGAPTEEERGVVAALPTPGQVSATPDTEFILTLGQLVCLKRKLEDPALVLDPSATIDLGVCE